MKNISDILESKGFTLLSNHGDSQEYVKDISLLDGVNMQLSTIVLSHGVVSIRGNVNFNEWINRHKGEHIFVENINLSYIEDRYSMHEYVIDRIIDIFKCKSYACIVAYLNHFGPFSPEVYKAIDNKCASIKIFNEREYKDTYSKTLDELISKA